ncbi:phage replisome organizer N-terminal domain-containing protein [Candidatus Pacearchaeota archaeon]|nr:phage replisome organizer N-terminal domain-containing protein [Candidatus Pacearchaeota archaeon]
MEWFKFYHNKWLTDLAISRLKPEDRLCFITLLCLASQKDNRNGVVLRVTEKEVIMLSRVDENVTQGCLKRMEEMLLIKTKDDGSIKILNFEKRQNSNLSGAERARRFRMKQKDIDDTFVTQSNVTEVTPKRVDKRRVDKIRKEESKEIVTLPKKKEFGEFKNVKLTEEEHKKLFDLMGEKNLNILIFELDTYIESKGRRYKSHYATIQTWARRKSQEIVGKKKYNATRV